MTNPKPHPRTTAQALAQQKADAERDRMKDAAERKRTAAQLARQTQDEMEVMLDQFAKSGQPQQAIVPAAKTAVAVPDNRTSVQQYVDEIAQRKTIEQRRRLHQQAIAA